VGRADDPQEREADEVAERVMRMEDSEITEPSQADNKIRRTPTSKKNEKTTSAPLRGLGGGCTSCGVQRKEEDAIDENETTDTAQAALVVGRADDPQEREADEVAERVMRMEDSEITEPSQADNKIRRTPTSEEDEETTSAPLRGLGGGCTSCGVQRKEDEDEERETTSKKKTSAPRYAPVVLNKPFSSRIPESTERPRYKPVVLGGQKVPSPISNQIAELRRNGGTPLPRMVRQDFENRFGQDFSQVRIHDGEGPATVAKQLRAKAFTLGHDVVFGQGRFQPETDSGKRLLAHELTHVVQQQKPGISVPQSIVDAAPVNSPPIVEKHTASTSSAAGRRTAPDGTPNFVQTTSTNSNEAATEEPRSETNNAEVPAPLRQKMETAFGENFSAVRVHSGSQKAVALDALAFTQGNDIHLAPGHWMPETRKGQELLGHELTHVVQQSKGYVQAAFSSNGYLVNDDPFLEQEADVLGTKAAHGEPVTLKPRSPNVSRHSEPLQTKTEFATDTSSENDIELDEPNKVVVDPAGESVSAYEDVSPPVQAKSVAAPIQAYGRKPIQRRRNGKTKIVYVPYQIRVTQPMTREQFKEAAMLQVFSAKIQTGLNWELNKTSYVPENSPYPLNVDVNLLKRYRSGANRTKGIDIDNGGGISKAPVRAKKFQDMPTSVEKDALMTEIDRRFSETSGSSAKIKKGETGKAELWKTIRDEVLFQHDYFANLPPNVKLLISLNIKGKELSPADYEQLFRIAKKIEGMPPGQSADYASKITGTTSDLNVFETSLDTYIAEMAKRQKQADEREAIKFKLGGLEAVYKKYRAYCSMLMTEAISSGALAAGHAPITGTFVPTSLNMREELEKELHAYKFASITEFETYIRKFEEAFEQEAANVALDVVAQYAGKLYKESERYQDPKEISSLYQALGSFRTHFAEFDKNATISNSYNRAAEQARLPGQGHLHPSISQEEDAMAAYKKAVVAKEAAKSDIQGLAGDRPIFAEEALPIEKRINKVALAKASEKDLGGVMQAHVATRVQAVADAKAEIQGNPKLIYKMKKLMPVFYAQMGISPGSIFDLIIQDKLSDDAIIKIVEGIATAIVAIALTVVSMGTATPAIVAAGAAVAGFGLSASLTYAEYRDYTQQKKLADVGFADDPSIVWLIIGIAGAALDLGAAVNAVRALGPAAKALNVGGDLARFNRTVRTLEQAGEIDAKIARAAERAAAAKKSFTEATNELGTILVSRVYAFPGPFTDPDVYRQLVKMAAAKSKEVGNNSLIFIAELKKARTLAKLGEMTPEELAKVKQAWEEAKALSATQQELALGAKEIAEIRKTVIPVLPNSVAISDKALVRLSSLEKTILPKLKSANAIELERLGSFLAEDPTLAERLLNCKNPFGALKKASTVVEIDRAMLTSRLVELNVNPVRIAPALERTGLSTADLAKLSDADIKALGQADRLIAEARKGFGPGQADIAKLAQAQAEFDKVASVSKVASDEIRASIAHGHGISDLPFMRNPGEALATRFPNIPKAKMDALLKRHPDALRALESATEEEAKKVIKTLEEVADPKDVEDILRSYMYKSQKRIRKPATEGGTEGRLDVPEYSGQRLGESLDNLALARKQGHPFGFKDKASYEKFLSTVESELASRGIKGKPKVQGSAMHSKTPGDIDMAIVVDQTEFDKLAEKFLKNARSAKEREALKISIMKKKIPSYEFYPTHDPSLASNVKNLTLGADGKPLDVQATLIAKGSDFDLGPFL
jgi:hypothetical protein